MVNAGAPGGISNWAVAQSAPETRPRLSRTGEHEDYSKRSRFSHQDVTIEADSAEDANELLRAVLSEWIDFLFVPMPKPFVIYADHDERATFLAHRKAGVTKVVEALAALYLPRVDWVREV